MLPVASSTSPSKTSSGSFLWVTIIFEPVFARFVPSFFSFFRSLLCPYLCVTLSPTLPRLGHYHLLTVLLLSAHCLINFWRIQGPLYLASDVDLPSKPFTTQTPLPPPQALLPTQSRSPTFKLHIFSFVSRVKFWKFLKCARDRKLKKAEVWVCEGGSKKQRFEGRRKIQGREKKIQRERDKGRLKGQREWKRD